MSENSAETPPSVPRIAAAIDVGTNSVKLLVAALDRNETRRVYETSAVTRLGEAMQAQSLRLREAAMRRTVDALVPMVAAAREHGAADIVAVGTAALRDAENREEFLRRVRDRCGLDVEVIPGQEEARLSFMAVRLDAHWRDCEMLVVIDIGGGSTEIIHGRRHTDYVAARVSVNVGAVRVTESYLKSDPPTINQLTEANRAIVHAFAQVEATRISNPFSVVTVGGTASNLAGMDAGVARNLDDLHGHVLTADRLEQMIDRLAISTVEQRKEIVGLDPRRADIILGGALLLSQAMARIGCTEVSVSMRGLRWGLLFDRFSR
jgi:exopolyphosphatase / guanosine-5'-triphosphate,3'-diphosphate pyrophosphatase